MAASAWPEPQYAMSAGGSVAVYIGMGALAVDGAITDRVSQLAKLSRLSIADEMREEQRRRVLTLG